MALHRLSNIDPTSRQADCIVCGRVRVKQKKQANYIGWRCTNKGRNEKAAYKVFRKDYCEAPNCTSVIVHPCQLDVDHIDGNHSNNDPSNLQTLCANCHRLKTYLERVEAL